MNPNYDSYMTTIHQPANKSAHGMHLTLSDSQPFRYVGVTVSIEPTAEIIIKAERQQEIDDINAASMGIAFRQLFKKK